MSNPGAPALGEASEKMGNAIQVPGSPRFVAYARTTDGPAEMRLRTTGLSNAWRQSGPPDRTRLISRRPL
jgi:hypothetical protein